MPFSSNKERAESIRATIDGGALSDRVDVYAAGIILFTLLTGQHPFLSKEPSERPSALELARHLRAYTDATSAPELVDISWQERERRTAVEGRRRFGRASGE